MNKIFLISVLCCLQADIHAQTPAAQTSAAQTPATQPATPQTPPAQPANPPAFPGAHSSWHDGFDRYDYIMDDNTLAISPYRPPKNEGFAIGDPPPGHHRCVIVVPKKPAPGNPWSWRGCYWDHQPQTEIELLKRGFYIAYISANASLKPGKEWDAWYTWLTKTHGLSTRPAFIGMSRGGEYEYRWATTHPDKVACIYADNPAVDRESLTLLGGLAANDVPLLHICGSIDPLYAGSTAAVENIYHAFGGRISVMIKEGFGHHPHSLHDATPIADFIENSVHEHAAPTPSFIKAVYKGPGSTPQTWYYSTTDTYRWSAAEKTFLTERGPFFSAAYRRYQLLIPGVDAFTTVIVPQKPAADSPWVFRADYITPDDAVDQSLLAKGWYIVTGAVPYNYDGPVLTQWNAIYKYLESYGFAKKAVMMGRGAAAGEAIAWAIENPGKVSCIYAENPIFQSKLMHPDPLDSISVLAKANIPLLFTRGNNAPKGIVDSITLEQGLHN
ncbi:MAG TPA: hypothetical protein VG605_13035 [Puia sp.]|nr:hypothetical protein [Puia sp.]